MSDLARQRFVSRVDGAGGTMSLADRMQASRVPGISVAVVDGGEITWSDGFGVVAFDEGSAITPDTVFQVASVSKLVSALGVLRLSALGQLPLDKDVRELVAWDIPVHPLANCDGREPITVRMVLQHRSGIIGRGTTPDRRGAKFVKGGGGSHRVPDVAGSLVPTMEESWHGKAGVRHRVCITHAPNTRKSYSGAGFLILQHLVEQATGQSFAAWMEANVLRPLGMPTATFDLEAPPNVHLAHGHDLKGRPLPGRRELVPWATAGGLQASARELAAIVQVINGHGSHNGFELLPPAWIAAMLDQKLGIEVARRGQKRERWYHGGTNKGFRAMVTGLPRPDAGIVLCTNGAASDATKFRSDIVNALLEANRLA